MASLAPDFLDALHEMGFSRAHVQNADQYDDPFIDHVFATEDGACEFIAEGPEITLVLIAQNRSFRVMLDRELDVRVLAPVIRTTLDAHRAVYGS